MNAHPAADGGESLDRFEQRWSEDLADREGTDREPTWLADMVTDALAPGGEDR